MSKFPDCARILPRLYQGEQPPPDETLLVHGFDDVVLCAIEYQPPREVFCGIRVHRCPFDDDFHKPLTADERRAIFDTGARVARAVRMGARVYVSCRMGLNRSGIVTALAVRHITGVSGREARHWVQMRRPGALQNPLFASLLDGLGRVEGRGEVTGSRR